VRKGNCVPMFGRDDACVCSFGLLVPLNRSTRLQTYCLDVFVSLQGDTGVVQQSRTPLTPRSEVSACLLGREVLGRIHTSMRDAALLSDRFSVFLPPLKVSCFGPCFGPCPKTLVTVGAPFAWPFIDRSFRFLPATSLRLASVSGSKVSLRKADRCRFAWGSLIESSGPVVRVRFGRDWDGGSDAASGENMMSTPACGRLESSRRSFRRHCTEQI
jgi:hypothetical protein